jgi:hypothetical protein
VDDREDREPLAAKGDVLVVQGHGAPHYPADTRSGGG